MATPRSAPLTEHMGRAHRRGRRAPGFRLALVLALSLAACGASAGGDTVKLLTGDPTPGACFTNYAQGLLIVDAHAGTAIIDGDVGGTTAAVMWRMGFTGRRAGSDVQVLDPTGKVVATTGRSYTIPGGYYRDAFFACGDPR